MVATPVRSVLQPLVGGLGQLDPVRLDQGGQAELDEVVTRLVEIGYARVDLVTNRGEIAVRGGILDVFPPTEEHPLRVEFFGSEIEEIRPFRAADQRSLGTQAESLWAPPCRELLLTPAVRHRAKQLASEYPGLGDVLGKIADGITVEGMEAFAPLLADRMELLLDSLPPGAIVVACDPERIRTRAADLVRTSQEFLEASWVNAAAGAQVPIDLGGAAFRPITEVRAAAGGLGIRWWTITPFAAEDHHGLSGHHGSHQPVARQGPARGRRRARDANRRRPGRAAKASEELPAGQQDEADGRESLRIMASPATAYHGDTARVIGDVRGWLAGQLAGRAGHRGARARPAPRRAPARREPRRARRRPGRARRSRASPWSRPASWRPGSSGRGSGWPCCARTTWRDQRPRGRDRSRMPSRRRGGIDPLQLTPGDYIVHSQHGVGRYLEMTSRTIQGATREYLVIEYAPSKRGQPPDRLYLPTDQLDEVTRYSGGEAPSLHRLGGADWAKTKGRARKAVREIAAQLIRLYSARVASPGHAFGPGHTRGSASWRTRSPTPRRPTSSPRSTRSSATWRSRSRWTG